MSTFKYRSGRVTALAVLVLTACGQMAFGQTPRDVRAFFTGEIASCNQVRLASQLRVDSAEVEALIDDLGEMDPTQRFQGVKPIDSIDLKDAFDPVLSAAPATRNSQAELVRRYGNGGVTLDYPWAPRNVVHRPLYFQDVLLERHGFTYGPVLQPIKSGVRFLGDALVFPIRVVKQPCHQRQSVLGLDRPGS